MSKRDYILIARAIAAVWTDPADHVDTHANYGNAIHDVTVSIGKALATDNPRFDMERFIAASMPESPA
jgi:hypothetical protein